ncbi:hypothetical protein MUP00_10435, partial [Candidatus Bathyarchaeota archaeon]|nr:hypothetical protein [Candidatus Bathyarchaeota archaeon]
MASDPSRQPQNPAPQPVAPAGDQNPAPEASSPPLVTNPFKEGTKKFLVAKALLSGELDRGKVVRETGVSLNTVYNVTGELAKLGYTLAIHQTQAPTTTPTFTPTPTSTHQATHPATPVGSQSDTLGGTPRQVTQQNQNQV